MRIAITGHCGYLGSYCYYQAVGMVSQVGGGIEAVLGVDRANETNPVDVFSEEGLKRITDFAPDIIVNFAGVSGEAACLTAPIKDLSDTAWGPRHLRRCCNKLIQISSCSVYAPGIYAGLKMSSELATGTGVVLRLGTVIGVNRVGKMRWDLPAHKMIQDAVRQKAVEIDRAPTLRPWVRLQQVWEAIYKCIRGKEDRVTIEVANFNAYMHEIVEYLKELDPSITILHVPSEPTYRRSYSAEACLAMSPQYPYTFQETLKEVYDAALCASKAQG